MVSGELEPKLDWVSGLAGRSWLIPERDWRGGWGLAGDSLGNGYRAAEQTETNQEAIVADGVGINTDPWPRTKPLLLLINTLFPTPYVRKQMNSRTAAAPQTRQNGQKRTGKMVDIRTAGTWKSHNSSCPSHLQTFLSTRQYLPLPGHHHLTVHSSGHWAFVSAACTGLILDQWVLWNGHGSFQRLPLL